MDSIKVLQIKIKRMENAKAGHTEAAEIARLATELNLLRFQLAEAMNQTGVQRAEPKREEDGDLLFA